jgi:hypothetical protein
VRRISIWVLIVVLGWAPALMAQQLQFLGSSLWNDANDIEAVGHYAYLSYPSGLMIFDVSSPASPVYAGKLFCDGKGYKLDISGNYVYLADGPGGLKIIDISNQIGPELVSSYSTMGDAAAVFVSGQYAYITVGYHVLQIVDISDPANPLYTGYYHISDDINIGAVAVRNQYLFMGTVDWQGTSYLEIFDISDHTTPIPVWSDTLGIARPKTFHFIDHYIYIGYSMNDPYGVSLVVYDISNPTSPVRIRNWETFPYFSDFSIVNNTLYGTIGQDLRIYDITNHENPVALGSLTLNVVADDTLSISVEDGTAYITSTGFTCSLNSVDISNASSPALIGSYDSYHQVQFVTAHGNYAYASDARIGSSKFDLLDLTDPTNPTLISSCALPYMPFGIAATDNYAYVANYGEGFKVVDIRNPSTPAVIASLPINGRLFNVITVGNYAYLANYDQGLFIIDISNPSQPTQAGFFQCGNNCLNDLSISGHYAYLAGNSRFGGISSFFIVDISNQQSPILVDTLNFSVALNGVAVSENYAYVCGDGFFGIIDISDFEAPVLIGGYLGNMYGTDVEVRGDLAYVSDYYNRILIFNISDPEFPYILESHYLAGPGCNIALNGNRCLVSYMNGMAIYQLPFDGIDESNRMPGSISIAQNYPNPFNAHTSINYSLSKTSQVEINIYNIMGQKVTTLSEGIQPAGEHKAIWEATDFTSGIYFAKLEAGEKNQTIKMVLLK